HRPAQPPPVTAMRTRSAMSYPVQAPKRRQRGAVLVVSLLILVLLTLATLTAIQASTVQERLAGNSRSLDLALQAAEAALREAEGRLESTVLPPADGTAGWYHYELAPAPDWSNPSSWSGNSRLG